MCQHFGMASDEFDIITDLGVKVIKIPTQIYKYRIKKKKQCEIQDIESR